MAPRGRFRNPQDLADLLEGESLVVAEHDDGPLVGPQAGKCLLQGIAQGFAFDRVHRRRGSDVQRRTGRARARGGPRGGWLTPAQRVDASIVSDTE